MVKARTATTHKPDEPMRVGLYLRVSTESQSSNGASMNSQEHALNAYSAAKSWRIVKVFREKGFSAKNTQRPALQQLLAAVKAGEVDVVAIYKLDRLTRSVRDLCDLVVFLKKYRVELLSLSESLDTSSASGMLLVNILGSVAQWERESIAARTRAALQRRRENGEVYGPVPLGFRRRGNRLVPDDKRMEVVEDSLIRDARVFGPFITAANPTSPRSPSNGGLPVIPNVAKSMVLDAARITASTAGFTTFSQWPVSIHVCAHVLASSCVGGNDGLIPFIPRN